MHGRLFLEKCCRIKSYCTVNAHMLLFLLMEWNLLRLSSLFCVCCTVRVGAGEYRMKLCCATCCCQPNWQNGTFSHAEWQCGLHLFVEIPQCDLTDLPAVPQDHEMCLSTSSPSCKFQCSCIIMIVFWQFIMPTCISSMQGTHSESWYVLSWWTNPGIVEIWQNHKQGSGWRVCGEWHLHSDSQISYRCWGWPVA